MNKNHRSIVIAALVFTTLFLVTATATLTQAYGSTIALSGFSVTPIDAPKGAAATGSVNVQNLDTKNDVTVVVTFYDGGAPVADNSANPTIVPKAGTVSVQLAFNTVADPPHCYAASATPGPVTVGYCEPGGHVLGGESAPIANLALMASTVAVALVAITGILLTALRRRRTN